MAWLSIRNAHDDRQEACYSPQIIVRQISITTRNMDYSYSGGRSHATVRAAGGIPRELSQRHDRLQLQFFNYGDINSQLQYRIGPFLN